MFTGIVEDKGRVVFLRNKTVSIKTNLDDIKTGDSVMVDGVCLTVTEYKKGRVTMEIGTETMKCTSLGKLRPGLYVNIERSLRLSDRISGHMVYGHIMATGRVISKWSSGNTLIYKIKSGTAFTKKLVEKGSVAVNGVSLTINELGRDYFTVGIIPETLKRTNFDNISNSSIVNLEADLLVSGAR